MIASFPMGMRVLNPPDKKSSGFTLVELLIVLVVIGIVLGMAAVQLMPDERAVLREESERLALLLENAQRQSRASGQKLAWSDEKNGYVFLRKNDYGDWVRDESGGSFRARSLPAGMAIGEVSVEGKALQPGEPMALDAGSFPLPFRIRLQGAHSGATLVGSSTGSVSVKMDGQDG